MARRLFNIASAVSPMRLSHPARAVLLAVAWLLATVSTPLPALEPDTRGWGTARPRWSVVETHVVAFISAFTLGPKGIALCAASTCMLITPLPLLLRRLRAGTAGYAWTSWGLLLVWAPPLIDFASGTGAIYLYGYFLLAGAYMVAFVAIDRRAAAGRVTGTGGFPVAPPRRQS